MLKTKRLTNLSHFCKYPLLSQEEEVKLSRQVQAMLTHPEPIPNDIRRRGQLAKRRMIEGNLRLVMFMASKFSERGVEIDDLISEGIIGLNRAVEKFDPTKGCRFSTYSCLWIKQSMNRAIANQARTIRIPVHVIDNCNKIAKWERSYYQRQHKSPSRQEVDDYLRQEIGISYSQFQNMKLMVLGNVSLDACMTSSESDFTLSSFVKDDRSIQDVMALENREEVSQILCGAGLTEREKQVLVWYFFQDFSLHQIGERLGGITRERVRQIKHKALQKCRQFANFELKQA